MLENEKNVNKFRAGANLESTPFLMSKTFKRGPSFPVKSRFFYNKMQS